jgi:alpha-L-fucosidase 2
MKCKNYFLVIGLCGNILTFGQPDNILRYNRPADFFEESLVSGNGKLGASIFGGVRSDIIYLNDATLWSGEPVEANMNPDAYKNLPAVRTALKNNDYKSADSLNRKIQGTFSESYAPLGTLYIDHNHNGAYKNYYRELNIGEAVSSVNYEIDGKVFQREYFVSYPDQVMVIRLKSNEKDAINCSVRFKSLL